MRKPSTPEQKAAAIAKRDRIKAMAKQIAAMSETERLALAAKYSIVTIQGHALSLVNQMLIIMQNPRATVVGGFRQWKGAGRAVAKGQHGLSIWIPVGAGRDSAADLEETTRQSGSDRPRFICGTVFDITQTVDLDMPVAA